MKKGKEKRRQFATPRASLCVLGQVVRELGVLKELEQVKVPQKVLRYTPPQKLAAVLVGMLAGATTVKETDTTLGTDPALQQAFGLLACPDQSTLQDTLDAATSENVVELRSIIEALFLRYSPVVSRLAGGQRVWVDIDLTPLPASARAEGSERGYMGRERSKTGRKLLRVRIAPEQEIVYQRVVAGKAASGVALLQEGVLEMERVLGLDTLEQRALVAVRLDSGFGGEESHRWLLERGYHLLGKMKSGRRARNLAGSVTEWLPTSSPGREVGVVQTPVDLGQPTRQYGVRTPSQDQPGSMYYAVLVSTLRLTPQEAVEEYDGRAGIENDFKADKQGLGLRARRKRKLAAQEMVLLLAGLARNLLLWCRSWLAQGDIRLGKLGIVRLVREVWAVPGRVTFQQGHLTRVKLTRTHPLGRQVRQGLGTLLQAIGYPNMTLGYSG
jgi:hypothetical protein